MVYSVTLFFGFCVCSSKKWIVGPLFVGYPRPFDHDDAKLEPLREDSLALALELPRADLNRDDGRKQPDQRCAFQTYCPRYGAYSHEPRHRFMGDERPCAGSGRRGAFHYAFIVDRR